MTVEYELQWSLWKSMNYLVSQGDLCRYNLVKLDYIDSSRNHCDCSSDTQSMSHLHSYLLYPISSISEELLRPIKRWLLSLPKKCETCLLFLSSKRRTKLLCYTGININSILSHSIVFVIVSRICSIITPIVVVWYM